MRKKHILPIVALGLATSSFAQDLELKPISSPRRDAYSILPAKFNHSGHDLLTIVTGVSDDERDADASIIVMDSNLNEIKKIPLTRYTMSTSTCWRDTVYTHKADWDFSDESGDTKFLPSDSILQWFPHNYYTSILDSAIQWQLFGGETPFIFDEDFKLNYVTKTPEKIEVNYVGTMIVRETGKEELRQSTTSKRYIVKGTIVLKEPFTYGLEENGKKQYNFQILCNAEFSEMSRGEWKEKVESEWKESPFRKMDILDANTSDNTVSVSQNIFNEDDSYEWIEDIMEPYEEVYNEVDLDGDGEIDCKKINHKRRRTGYRIMQDTGNVLAEIKFGEGRIEYNRPSLIVVDGKKYLELQTCDNYESSVEAQLYEIISKGSSTSLKKVRTDYGAISASPAIARQNEVVTVDLSSIKEAKVLNVVSGNGQLVLQQNLKAGQNQVLVHTSGLAAGMYVITVSDGKNTTENCRIIVR